jgi:hypothetical protein
MRAYVSILFLGALICATECEAQLARRGGGPPPNLQNRSTVNRNVNTNQNFNRNTNVNQNVNVNRNVNVNSNYHGCNNCGWHDDSWNWGSFAAGAATTAVVSNAARTAAAPVAYVPPAVGTVVTTLPGGCATIAGGVSMYNCGNVYYRPYYQGTALVYQVVRYP